MANNTHPGTRSPMPTEEPLERVAAMIEWLKEINGGTLPQGSSASPAIDGLDALVAKLGNTSLEDIKANMSDEFQSKVGISDMTEAALRSLILSAAKMAFETEEALNSLTLSAGKMSISSDNKPEAEDDEAMLDAPQQATYTHISGDWRGWEDREQQETLRCWTSGTSTCTCRVTVRDYGSRGEMYEDGVDVACDLDCPVGKSVTEMRGQWKEFSPCCGELDCVCTDATRQSPWLCSACGQVNGVCEE